MVLKNLFRSTVLGLRTWSVFSSVRQGNSVLPVSQCRFYANWTLTGNVICKRVMIVSQTCLFLEWVCGKDVANHITPTLGNIKVPQAIHTLTVLFISGDETLLNQPVRQYARPSRKKQEFPSQLQDLHPSMLKHEYASVPLAQSVDDVVKKLLTLELANHSEKLRLKEEQLIAKVRRDENDRSSTEHVFATSRSTCTSTLRKKKLKLLRRTRYDSFEKVCQELGITYTFPPEYYRRVTRRWLAKKAFCNKIFQEVQKQKAEQREKQRAAEAKGKEPTSSTEPQGAAAYCPRSRGLEEHEEGNLTSHFLFFFAGLFILTNMSNPVITQPGAGSYGTNVQTGEWSTGALGCICPIALSCYAANKYGENVCLACVPGGMAAMRTHMRLTYGIQGTICNDALMTCCCGIFETCRMTREILFINTLRITSPSRSSTSASDWLLLAVTWQPREGLQTLIYSAGSSESADRGFLLTTCDCLPILAALHPSPERMSTRTLPLLFINLGGEMLYILDQRLRAQNIPADKAKKVMNDIITTMFNKKFLEELFKPQELYSKKALRTVFDRLAHASIMRLNQASMDKLYDLMTMAFKYQVLLCPRPKDILLVSFNHMDAIRDFVKDTPSILSQVDETNKQLIEVSIFLKDKVQNSNGRFVLPTSGPVPMQFRDCGNYSAALREGSFEMYGDRVIKLGTNMYSVSRPVETHMSGTSKNSSQHTKVNTTPNPLAKEELNLLARLMGGLEVQKSANTDSGFRVNLFATDEEEEEALISRPDELSYEVINIQATKDKQTNAELAKIMGEFGETGEPAPSSSSKGDDLLAMMDGL
ncbi:Protein OSCP1 [Labeo rohita]|uniref:Protein OSCP1 n=1 Tax=Labeo rohita TaxID=84645 RepID=A0ABQ8LXD0_LABRO|nr:Protein OSCP1 [Labeo rohita]